MSKEPELKDDEKASLKALEALEKHLARKPEMLAEYREYDEKAITLAHRVVAEAFCASPYANASNYELSVLRQKRDDANWRWNRTLDQLEAAVQKLNLPVILRFHELSMQRLVWLGNQRETVFVTGLGEAQIDKRRVRAKSNFLSITKEQKKVMDALDGIKKLHCSSLHEVRLRIKEANDAFESVALTMEEGTFFESEYRAMQELEGLPALQEREILTRDLGVLPAK